MSTFCPLKRFASPTTGRTPRLLLLLWLCLSALLPCPVPAQNHTVRSGPLSLDSRIQWVLRQVSPSVVGIWEDKENLISGVVISQDGLVATCAHITAKVGERVEIDLADGRRVAGKVASKLVKEGEKRTGKDIALVQITAAGTWPAVQIADQIADQTNVTSSDWVVGIGFPDTLLYGRKAASRPRYVRLGHLIVSPYSQHPDVLVTSLFGTGGDSGGPLFDLSGNLIGLVSSGDGSGAHMAYTRIDVLRRNWKALAGTHPALPSARVSHSRVPLSPEAVLGAARALAPAIVEVRSNERWIGLGCVVGPGRVLTKASELGPNLTLAFAHHYVAVAKVIATDPANDLALLNVPAAELTHNVPTLQWTHRRDVPSGSLLAVATPAELTPPVGVVCFGAQAVPGLPGMLPYATKEATGGVEVTEVWNEQMQVFLRPPTYPLRVGDLITHVEGIPIRSRDAYIKMVFEDAHIGVHPRIFGEPVRVTYRREEQSATETIVLAAASTPSIQLVRPVSYRYTGFVSALATDLPVRPEQCGAPVVDSQGHVVGILIARAPYVETLVLPAREVLASLEKMNQQAKALP